MYRDVRGERSVGGGMPGAWHGRAGHRAQMASNVIAARIAVLQAPGGPIGAAQGGFRQCDKGRTVGGVLSAGSRQAINQPWRPESCEYGCEKSGVETASVIDAITRRASFVSHGRLSGTYPFSPNNPILQSCALPDYNCGATLVRTGMCVHVSFHRICILAGPMDTPLCKISF
jgi:hypothetical protein